MVSILSLGRQVRAGCDHRVNPTDNSISHFDCLYMCVCVCCVKSRVSSFGSYKNRASSSSLSRFSRFFRSGLRRYQKCGAVQGAFSLKEVGCSPPLARFCLSVDACTSPWGVSPETMHRERESDEQQRRAVDPFQCPEGKIDARSLAGSLVFTTPMTASEISAFFDVIILAWKFISARMSSFR